IASGLAIPRPDAVAFIKMYDLFFVPELRCAITQSGGNGRSPGATAPQIIGEGISIGGLVWAQRVNSRFNITRLTVPPSSEPARRAPRTPQRIGFTSRQPVLQFSGRLARDDVDAYVLWARKDQVLQATIQGFSGHDAEVEVVAATTGAPIERLSRAGARTWSGRVPDTGDYRINVL